MTTDEMREIAKSACEEARFYERGNDTVRRTYLDLVDVLWSCCAEICDRLDSIRDELRHANRND